MKKALIVCTVACFLGFEINDMKILKSMGYKIFIATNFDGYEEVKERLVLLDTLNYQVDFNRSPFSFNNYKAYKQLKSILLKDRFDIVHCHTPVGGVLTRLAAKKYRKDETKIIYTAHGFHFYKGAPIRNWLIYYPIEKYLSRYTDCLITINKEDYQRAKEKFHMKKIEYIPGVGVDIDKYAKCKISKEEKRKSLNIPETAFVLLSVGELNRNKNHQIIIKAVSKLKDKNIHYCIAGKGPEYNNLLMLARKLNVQDQVHLLGYRNDIDELLKMADVFCFPSKREGLGLAAIEAMASGLPLVTSNVHGINDYNIDGITGYSSKPLNVNGFSGLILKLSNENLTKYNNIFFAYKFDKKVTIDIMKNVYGEV